MKKLLILLGTTFALNTAQAQVPNPSFEQHFTATDILQHWGNEYIHHAWTDSLGNWHQDSILYASIASSTDAHSGTYAMQLQNAYNYTQSRMEIGKAACSTDSFFSSYVPSFLSYAPQKVSFWYKYFPVSGDTARVHIVVQDPELTDSSMMVGLVIADTFMTFTAAQITYQFAEVPLRYTHTYSSNQKQVTITFTTGSEAYAHTGTRMLIDDMQTTRTTSVASIHSGDNFKPALFPNPASDLLTVCAGAQSLIKHFRACDLSGKTVFETTLNGAATFDVDTKNWSAGTYITHMTDNDNNEYSTLINKD